MNMLPFVDIMLVLLTIVLTTSSFIASGRIPVNLPQASASRSDTAHTQTIAIDAAGTVHFGGEAVDTDALKARLAPLDRQTAFLLRADRTVQLQRFIDVADVLKQLGFAKVAVQTEAGKR
ncbi:MULTISPECIES: biopolymer transporter ExbD [unclassified Variovorax]|jgi:biopolymer transport protein ExbD|uniref:ExbD/TolR family protein n=1 Tax=unclassified Variovorax TaxID=663243 RepID=UPI000A8CEE24|nr:MULTISPECIES: biopolymer transporter ExbD [unclassified Variovorax]